MCLNIRRDCIKRNIKRTALEVEDWRTVARDRGQWRRVVHRVRKRVATLILELGKDEEETELWDVLGKFSYLVGNISVGLLGTDDKQLTHELKARGSERGRMHAVRIGTRQGRMGCRKGCREVLRVEGGIPGKNGGREVGTDGGRDGDIG